MRCIADNPGVLAPRLLSSGQLFDDPTTPWPYLVTTRMPRATWEEAALSTEDKSAIAADLGRQVRRIRAALTLDTPQIGDYVAQTDQAGPAFLHGNLFTEVLLLTPLVISLGLGAWLTFNYRRAKASNDVRPLPAWLCTVRDRAGVVVGRISVAAALATYVCVPPLLMFVAHQMVVVSHEHYFLQRMFGLLVAGATLTACLIWSYRQSLSRRAGQT